MITRAIDFICLLIVVLGILIKDHPIAFCLGVALGIILTGH